MPKWEEKYYIDSLIVYYFSLSFFFSFFENWIWILYGPIDDGKDARPWLQKPSFLNSLLFFGFTALVLLDCFRSINDESNYHIWNGAR